MMKIKISNRAMAIKPSPTLSVSARAKQMKAQGIDVINFGVGEPDFNTPEYIKDAARKAIDDNFTRYTETAGIMELREAICAKFKKENGLDYTPAEVLVSPGAKASIQQVLMAVCDVHDQVLIPAPYWVSYPTQVAVADALCVFIPTDASNGFKMTAAQLETAIAKSSTPKALILNSPNNPTGAVYSRAELEAIAEVCVKHNLLIISDEIYEKLVYDGVEHVSIASLSPEAKALSVVINGVSKAYAMTGWRLGYAAGPKEIIQSAARIQEHFASNTNSITQKATLAALLHEDGSIEKMRLEFEKRRHFLVERLNQIEHVTCPTPHGAFYAMPDANWHIANNNRGIRNGYDLCAYLLEEAHIAVVAGDAFGADGFVRFSYANSMKNIEDGLGRFAEGLRRLIP
jgi:aspartate aminotransferase